MLLVLFYKVNSLHILIIHSPLLSPSTTPYKIPLQPYTQWYYSTNHPDQTIPNALPVEEFPSTPKRKTQSELMPQYVLELLEKTGQHITKGNKKQNV